MIYTETNWYEWELDLQKLVVIILRRSQIPVKTRAGPFGYLNYENLINVCIKNFDINPVTILN